MNLRTYSLRQLTKVQWLVIPGILFIIACVHYLVEKQLGFYVLNGDQYYHGVFALKQLHSTLFPLDPYYNDLSNFEAYTPLFLNILKPALAQYDLFTTFSFFQPWLGFSCLLTLFFLFYKLSGRPWLSMILALISATEIPAFPADTWGGVLSIGFVIPRTFFLIFLPLIFYGWLRSYHQPKRLFLIYFAVGLLTHIHPVSGATLTLSFLLAQLIQERFSLKSLKTALLCGLSALIPVIPFAINYFGNTQEGYTIPPDTFPAFLKATYDRLLILDPRFIIHQFPVAMLEIAGWLGLGIWAYFKTRRQLPPLFVSFILAIFGVFVSYYLINQLLLIPQYIPPVLIDIPRVTKFFFLPLFAIFAIWLAQYQGKALALRIMLVFFLGAFISYPTLIKEIGKSSIGDLLENQYKGYLQRTNLFLTGEKRSLASRYQAQLDASYWLKQNTDPKQTLVHVGELNRSKTDTMLLRTVSERSFLITRKDGGILYYTNKPLFMSWYNKMEQLLAIRGASGYCSKPEQEFAMAHGATHLVCYKVKDKTINLPLLYQNSRLWIYSLRPKSLHYSTR